MSRLAGYLSIEIFTLQPSWWVSKFYICMHSVVWRLAGFKLLEKVLQVTHVWMNELAWWWWKSLLNPNHRTRDKINCTHNPAHYFWRTFHPLMSSSLPLSTCYYWLLYVRTYVPLYYTTRETLAWWKHGVHTNSFLSPHIYSDTSSTSQTMWGVLFLSTSHHGLDYFSTRGRMMKVCQKESQQVKLIKWRW